MIILIMRRSAWSIAIIILPGTFLHEVSHYLVGLVLNGKPFKFDIFPVRNDKGWILGSVGFRRLTLWNSAFIGLSPLLLIPASYWVFVNYAIPLHASNSLGWVGACYLIACCLYSSIPSIADLKIAFKSTLYWTCIGVFLWAIGELFFS